MSFVESLLDPYDRHARLLPSIVIFSPFAIPSILVGSLLGVSITLSSAGGFLSIVALGQVFSQFIRERSKRVQDDLWSRWNGPPSSIVMRAEGFFSVELRKRIAEAIIKRFDIDLLEEQLNEETLEQRIFDAFELIKVHLREKNPKGLWFKHLREYGFLRNLYGSCDLWAWFAAISTAMTVGVTLNYPTTIHILACALAVANIGIALLARAWMLPAMLRSAAEEYAKQAWKSFLYLETEDNRDK